MSFYALVVFCVLFKFSKSFLRPDTEQKYITSVARYPARVGIFFFFSIFHYPRTMVSSYRARGDDRDDDDDDDDDDAACTADAGYNGFPFGGETAGLP